MRSILIGTVLATALVGTAAADSITMKKAKVTIDVPDNWKSSKNGDEVDLSDKHDDVAISFVTVDAGAINAATKAVGKSLGSKIDKLTFKKEEKVSFGGMKGISISGDGFLHGVNIDLAVVVLDTPADDKDLVIIAIGEDAKLAKHMDEIVHVFQNLHQTP
jgi:hypothetical protein